MGSLLTGQSFQNSLMSSLSPGNFLFQRFSYASVTHLFCVQVMILSAKCNLCETHCTAVIRALTIPLFKCLWEESLPLEGKPAHSNSHACAFRKSRLFHSAVCLVLASPHDLVLHSTPCSTSAPAAQPLSAATCASAAFLSLSERSLENSRRRGWCSTWNATPKVAVGHWQISQLPVSTSNPVIFLMTSKKKKKGFLGKHFIGATLLNDGLISWTVLVLYCNRPKAAIPHFLAILSLKTTANTGEKWQLTVPYKMATLKSINT